MKKLFLIIIILIATVLRLYKLDKYPALNADEAAIGYNAYSLLQTGRDEHGNPWPVHFQSFNDYKPGFYFYLVLPFVKVLGLNIWSVRLPNALLGIASVYLIYLLVKELFKERLSRIDERISTDTTALIASLILAISPWHLHFSRGGWEVNTATFFILMGVYCFVKYVNTVSRHPEERSDEGSLSKIYLSFCVCILSFALSLYTYHSARIVSPFLFTGMLVIYRDILKKNIKPLIISAVVGFIVLLPLMKDLTRSYVVSRVAGVGLFADTGPIERINEQRMEHSGATGIILHNKVVNYGLAFMKNWTIHYNGNFLFISGDEIQRDRVPDTGQLYLFELVTILVGLYYSFKYIIHNSKFLILVLFWLLIAPIPAALTFQSPHALRAQNMIIPLTIISALGLNAIIGMIHNTKYSIRLSFCFLLVAFVSWSFARYLHNYYLHMSKEYPFSSQYGVKELVDYLSTDSRTYKNIVVTNKYDQPYILFLFYSKYSPEKFQGGHVLTERDRYGFSTVEGYSNFIFKPIDWDRDKLFYRASLIIGSGEEIPDEANVTKRIYGSNGYLYFKVVEN